MSGAWRYHRWTPRTVARLRAFRAEGLSRTVIADRLGCSVSTVSKKLLEIAADKALEHADEAQPHAA